jgi:uncharacterized protein YhbP (UPF0306 family)
MDTHLKSFLDECAVGVLSTCDKQEIHTVPVYYCFIEAQKAFYFLTKDKSTKTSILEKNNKANFSIYSETYPRVFTSRCRAEILDIDCPEGGEVVKKLAEVHSTREYYPSPIYTMKQGSLKLVKLNLLDFTFKNYSMKFSEQKSA